MTGQRSDEIDAEVMELTRGADGTGERGDGNSERGDGNSERSDGTGERGDGTDEREMELMSEC